MNVTSGPNTRITRLKLMKDLKYGKVHLRQSLLQMSEFEDVSRLFKSRKDDYSIKDIDIKLQKIPVEEVEEEVNILMSPAERIAMFRKEKQDKKHKEKMQSLWSKQVKKVKPRVPTTSKTLEKFESKYKNEMHISYKDQLRESEINLEKIKKNNKTTFQTQSESKTLYRSRVESDAERKQSMTTPRKRFISLKTSLPEKDRFVYQSIREIMKGNAKENGKKPGIDLKSLENALDNYMQQSLKRFNIKVEKETESRMCITSSPLRMKEHRAVSSNVERSFTRSEESSQKMIDTMSNFYETKHQKKSVFDGMVNNLKYDRPLTASIRRKNYTVLGKEHLYPIKDYREVSEEQSRHLRANNHEFYCGLLELLENYHEEDVPTTVFIVEELKKIFEVEYMLHQEIFNELVERISYMRPDSKSAEVLQKVAQHTGFKISISPENCH